MSTIALEGIEVTAPIGIYRDEKINGCKFILDVYLTTDIDILKVNDNLHNTIDYEFVFRLTKSKMNHPFNLIESAIRDIYLGIIEEYRTLKEVKIRVRKLHPLEGEKIESAYVEGIFVNQ
jgi:7,8-dihydroneopterin aldolase/epimerase/oxygenase